ncbi:unnamed protein product, partial [Vitrella brassicaformis CCMP3155]
AYIKCPKNCPIGDDDDDEKASPVLMLHTLAVAAAYTYRTTVASGSLYDFEQEFSDAIDANDKDAVQLWAALAKADHQSALGKLLKSVDPKKLDIKKAKEIKKKLDKK